MRKTKSTSYVLSWRMKFLIKCLKVNCYIITKLKAHGRELDYRNFVVTLLAEGKVIACGEVKNEE